MGLPIPIIPIEIISEILSYLGKNDLLKCRLVSQPFNELSLKILRNPKYGHEHELNENNIQDFLEFSNGRNEEWVLPFHLKCTEYARIKLYPHFPNYIQQLQTIFGEKCVGGLTLNLLSSSSLESVQVLISILSLIAPSLTHLDLSQFTLRYTALEKMKVKEMLGKTQLNFLNLSKLKSCPPPNHWSEQENAIHAFLIEKTQNLQELEVISPYDLLVTQKQIGRLRKLKIVNEFALKNLEIDTILEPIRTTTPTLPVLKELSLTYGYEPLKIDDRIIHEFLSSFSTSLQSLSVRFERIPRKPFPRLSHLRLLRIQISPNRSRLHVDPTILNLNNSEALPVLESMDISTKVYFESSDSNSGNFKDSWSLPTVKNLIIGVADSSFNARPSAKDYVDHLQELFPSVTSLTLVNESDGHAEYLNQLLIAFIQSDGAPKIQELAIQNYKENYLGQILKGFPLDPHHQPIVIIKNMTLDKEFLNSIKKALQGFSSGSDLSVDKQMETSDGVENSVITCKAPVMHLKMTGLKKIRLILMWRVYYMSEQTRRERGSNQKDLFLMSLPKHFPLLKQIDISEKLFGFERDKKFCKQQIIQVQDNFPDLIININ